MEAESTSTDAPISPLNETVAEIGRLNTHIASYWYVEIPTVFKMIGIVLNAVIIIYFIASKKYTTPLFTILTSLAIMDMCACIGGVMHMFAVPNVITTGFMCWLLEFVTTLGIVGSEYHLIFFAALRFYQVMSPLKARASITFGLMVKWCIVIIALATVTAVCNAAYWRSLTTVIDGEEMTVCIFIGDKYSHEKGYFFIITLIPCVSIFLIHVLKYFAYLRSRDLVGTQQKRKSPDARVAAIVIALFYISLVPALTYITIQNARIKDYASKRDSLKFVFGNLIFANSIMNPLVYVLAVKSIRDDAIKLFCFGRHLPDSGVSFKFSENRKIYKP